MGGPDLQKRKREIQTYSDQTSATLKKSVYANYMQFIETAKEISSEYRIGRSNGKQLNIIFFFFVVFRSGV